MQFSFKLLFPFALAVSGILVDPSVADIKKGASFGAQEGERFEGSVNVENVLIYVELWGNEDLNSIKYTSITPENKQVPFEQGPKAGEEKYMYINKFHPIHYVEWYTNGGRVSYLKLVDTDAGSRDIGTPSGTRGSEKAPPGGYRLGGFNGYKSDKGVIGLEIIWIK